METLWQDLRYSIRMLFKSRVVTIVAIAAIALGVGANTAIFSVVNAVLLRPLPFDKPEHLVRLYTTNIKKGVDSNPTSYLTFLDWRDQSHSFEQVAAFSEGSAAITEGETPEQIQGVTISSAIFPMLGAKPILGRTFTAEEDKPGKTHVAVISEGLWRRRFGGDSGIIGRNIMLGGDSTTIVGVMPSSFKFPITADSLEFWVPLDPYSAVNRERRANYLSVVARLKPEASLEQAQSDMNSVSAQLQEALPEVNTARGIRLVSLHEATVGSVRSALLVLLGAVGFVLLIACANVANLLLARASGREKEIAVRTAMGATRGRIMRQLITESVLLSCIGGAVGLLLALWGVDFLVSWIPDSVPRAHEISLDSNVLLFTFGVSIFTGFIFGLAPALTASKLDLNESLKESGRGGTGGAKRSRLRNVLVISEIALSLMLLVGAGLLIRSFEQLRLTNPGLNPERVVTMSVSLSETKYRDDNQQARFFKELIDRIKASPGVASAGIVDPLPLSNNVAQSSFSVEGRPPLAPGDRLITHSRRVSADYLLTMQIPLLSGRALSDRDNEDAPKVMMVNETLARRYFPGEDPVGKRATVTVAPGFTAEIIGVVGDVKHRSLDLESGPEAYVSYLQAPTSSASLVIRSAAIDPTSVLPSVRNIVGQLDRDLPVADVRTMNDLLSDSVASRRFNMFLLGSFAMVALLLAGVGIYGVMAYSVAQRTREIGIRIALGAQARDVLKLVVGQGMYTAMIGVGIGLAGAFGLTRVMASLLFGVSPTDPVIFAAVALLLSLTALVACYIPARRAAKVDALDALRSE
jgi:putative ABC transport system permease protein